LSQDKKTSLVDRIYDFFCSIRLSIFVLVALAVTSIVGTILQQGAEYAEYVEAYGAGTARIIRALSLDDMYHSWWFTVLLALLLINIVFCSLKRMPAAIRLMKDRDPVFEGKATAVHQRWEKTLKKGSEADVTAAVASLLEKKMGKAERAESGGAVFLLFSKGGWARMGVYITHFSLFLFAVGAIVGLQTGFKGFVGIVEGRSVDRVAFNSIRSHPVEVALSVPTTDRAALSKAGADLAKEMAAFDASEDVAPETLSLRFMGPGSDVQPVALQSSQIDPATADEAAFARAVETMIGQASLSAPVDRLVLVGEDFTRKLPFTVRCDEFQVEFYPDGRPKEYMSLLSVVEDGREVVSKQRIEVNYPLIHRGIYFYQSSYGEVGVGSATLTVADQNGRIVATRRQVPIGQVLDLGNGMGLVPRDIWRDRTGRGTPSAVVLSLVQNGRAVAEGKAHKAGPGVPAWFWVGNYQVHLDEADWIYYTGLQVARDPGVPVVWLGCFLITIGLVVSFFFSHRRVWAKVAKEGEGVKVTVVGNASRNRISFERWFEEMTEEAREALEK
jgi:cytochrome c biogenesis protein ResB